VAGLALTPQPLARAGVGRREDHLEVDGFLGLGRVHVTAGVDDVGLFCPVRSADMI
jgi:hypothetical protein